MDYIKHLREERVNAYEQAKEILDRAGSESRSLDAEERQSVDRAFAHMDELKARENDFRSLEDAEQGVRRRVACRRCEDELVCTVLQEPRVHNG